MTRLYDDDGLTLPKDEAEYEERCQLAHALWKQTLANLDRERENVSGF